MKIVNTDDDTEHKHVSGERVVLTCEVSRDNAHVKWYKNGVELEESDNIKIEVDGCHRRLAIQSVQPQDSGEFVCDAGDDSVFYNVMVTGQQLLNEANGTPHLVSPCCLGK